MDCSYYVYIILLNTPSAVQWFHFHFTDEDNEEKKKRYNYFAQDNKVNNW